MQALAMKWPLRGASGDTRGTGLYILL